MQTEFRTLSPQDSLGEAARLLLAGSQQDFPVVESGRLAGMLPHATLLRALGEQGEGAPVASAMEQEFESVDANELLDWAMAHVNPDRGFTRPVLREGRLAGLLTAENVGEFFLVRSALDQRRKRGTPPRLSELKPPPIMIQPMAPRLAQNQ
jgi:predicted transcriptional regulator